MKRKEKIEGILAALDSHYSVETKCFLNYETPWQLLFATILSAQCTDDRVNIVTEGLFKKYPSLEAFALANLAELEQDVRSTGFYRNKAKSIIGSANMLITQYGGEMPSDIENLTALPGVGRKTANVVRGNIFALPSIVVDTHVKRVSKRLGLTKNTDPVKIEFDLMKTLPKPHWIRFNHQIIAHGRKICKAPTPKCAECFLTEYCSKDLAK